jgi:hypothetical protein
MKNLQIWNIPEYSSVTPRWEARVDLGGARSWRLYGRSRRWFRA